MTFNPSDIIKQAVIDWGIGANQVLKLETSAQIAKWFENFLEAEKEVIAHLVPAMRVVTELEINSRIREISRDLVEFLGDDLKSACLLPLGLKLNDSGAKFIYGFDRQLSDGTRSVTFNGSVKEAAEQFDTLIFIDDLVGSGRQAIKAFKGEFEKLDRRVIYAPIFAFEDGINEINAQASYDRIIVGETLYSDAKAFSDDSRLFPEAGLRSELREICEKYGNRLYARGPLGYEDTQALISFPHNCPNNTLPVIWAGIKTDEKTRGERWHPLRERIKFLTQSKLSPPSPQVLLEGTKANYDERLPKPATMGGMRLTQECRKIHSALALFGEPFSLEVLEIAVTGTGGHTTPLAYLEEAESEGLIAKHSSGVWELQYIPVRAQLQISQKEKRDIAGRIVTILLDKLKDGEASPFDPSRLNVAAAQQVLRVYDDFGHYDSRRLRLQQAICHHLEAFGDYGELLNQLEYEKSQQLEYEKSQVKEQSIEVYWYDFRIARTQYYMGDIAGAFAKLSRLYHEIANKAVANDRHQSRTIELKTSIIRQLCQVLADTGHPEVSAKLMLKVVTETDISVLSHTVAMMNMLGLSRALALSGFASIALSISDEIIAARYSGFLTDMTKAVSSVHRAIALSESGSPKLAVDELGEAIDFFCGVDKRAYCWALTQRASGSLKSGMYEQAAKDIREILRTSRQMNILTRDVVALISDEVIQNEVPDIVGDVRSFLAERRHVIEKINVDGESLYTSRFVEHVALELDAELDGEIKVELQELKLLTPLSHPKLNSQVMRTFLNAERSKIEELEDKIDNLLVEYAGEENVIFSSPVFNNIIVEACKKRKVLNKKFIYPFLDIILGQYGGILLFYARYFELIDDLENADICLENVKNKGSFAYLNIEANIAGKKDFEEGLRLNEEVLKKIPDFFHQQRSRIHNNIAHLIYTYRKHSQYTSAISHCEMSINLNRNPKFFFPRNLLLTLRIETSKLENIGAVLCQHHERFRPPASVLELAVGKVRDRERRNMAKAILRKGLQSHVG